MEPIDFKQLKKLTAFCRANGIKTFQGEGFAITLETTYRPEPTAYQRRKAKATGQALPKYSVQNSQIPTEAPSAEELLFLSCGGPPDGFEREDLPS